MKIKLSKKQWENMGKIAGWNVNKPISKQISEIASIGRNIIENSDFNNDLADIWEDAVSEGIEDMQKTNRNTVLQHFKDSVHEKITEWQRLIEGIEQQILS